jgi:PKD repeat protein
MCTPINVNPPATCDGLTVAPQSGIAPLSTSVSCTGTRATSYSISCGNGQTVNAQTGTCTYSAPGTYEARCTVNGTITAPVCAKPVSVGSPTPQIMVDKTDANSADLD